MLCINCGKELEKDNTYLFDHRYCVNCGNNHSDYLKERRLILNAYREQTLGSKIAHTQMLIQQAVNEFGIDKVYISYSGGKDSTVLSHIAKTMYPDILHIFANTTNEYPETLTHVLWEKNFNNTNLLIVTPKDSKGKTWTFKDVVNYYGYPVFSKRASNAIRTYQHARTEITKQNSLDYMYMDTKMLLFTYPGSDAADSLMELLDSSYILLCAYSSSECISLLSPSTDINVVLLDTPSKMEGVREVIEYVEYRNFSVFNIPILVLTSQEDKFADSEYLGGAVADVIVRPFVPRIITNRLSYVAKSFDSVSFAEFARMLKVLPANIYLKDSTGRYVFSSQTWHHLDTHNDPDWSIRGKTDIEIRKDKNNAKLAMESDLNILRTGKGTSYIIEENDGKREYLQLIKEPLFHEDGRVRGIIALINDVTEQEEMRRELVRVSSTDKLTGLYNRTCFENYLVEVLPKMEFPVSIVTGDCDGLKYINDTYGHQDGDRYIRMCADAISRCMPDDAVMFRTGGDEFIVLLPSCSFVTAEALISAVKRLTSSIPFKDRSLSISLGCSTLETSSSDVTAAIKASDDAMYQDKKAKG